MPADELVEMAEEYAKLKLINHYNETKLFME
jgi:hypothetical protein